MPLQPLSCIHCREKKRKCSRESPTCSRCHQLKLNCAYPTRWRGRQIERLVPGSPGNSNALSITANGYLTSKANGLQLLDAYFALFIPSTFVCHPSRLKARYNDDCLPSCVRDSVFSMATLLRSATTTGLASDTRSTSEATPPGEIWAQQASTNVVNQISRPSSDVLHTLFNLMVYWCAVGKTQKFKEHAKMALMVIRQLKMQELASSVTRSGQLERASFFVGIISQCITDDSEWVAPSTPFSLTGPLPSSEMDLHSPIRGQLLKFIQHWIKIRYFVRGMHADTDAGMQWATLFNLDVETRALYESLSPHLRDFNGQRSLDADFRESLGLQTLYHMCRFVPHIAMVRLFQKQKSPAEDYVQLCAQIAIRHINQVSDVIMNSVTSGPASLLTLPPFVAYCSFTSVSVYLSYLNYCGKFWNDANDPTIYLLRDRLLSNLYLLNRLRRVWNPVRVMWEAIQMDVAALGISNTDVEAYDDIISGAVKLDGAIAAMAIQSPQKRGRKPTTVAAWVAQTRGYGLDHSTLSTLSCQVVDSNHNSSKRLENEVNIGGCDQTAIISLF
ncbi:hypothetical protein ABOM_002033 [Aspergillus bombycis]|uniref:Zn(2)-C6 fungal-type domain-containing protein n=1 Tax=Aspergillus bombycis TaxID=109264 RepID=A0A1F8AAI2_9EURO|nr:hypothetical protein ABOM_002033 [Aspergillus bombycis]OGM48727.1 hypothetical protein ABOM_002033 [Aspergillus bombycis]